MKKELLVSGLFVLMFVIFGCATPVSDTIPEQTPEVQEQKSDSFTNETVPEEVIEEEGSFEDTRCSRTFSPKFSTGPYYNGPLFDAHFHMPNLIDASTIQGHGPGPETESNKDPILGKDVELSKLLCNFDKENVVGVIGFTIGAEQVLDETIIKAKSIREKSLGKINLFLMPGMFGTENLENIEQSNDNLFKGYGEMAFYVFPYANIPPDSPNVMEVYAVAGKHGLIVMIHPGARQESQVENAIKKNPNVKFLIHGPEIENSIANIISKYPNAYYSIDAILIRAPGSPGGLIYTTNNLQELKSSFSQNYDKMMSDAVSKWKSKIEKYPDRFMWGTDRAYLWHYDEDVGLLLEEFGRDFIAELDPTVQEKYAYQNAEELIKR